MGHLPINASLLSGPIKRGARLLKGVKNRGDDQQRNDTG
jgi:hypothetical protein